MRRFAVVLVVLIAASGPSRAGEEAITVHSIVKTDEKAGVLNEYQEERTVVVPEVREVIGANGEKTLQTTVRPETRKRTVQWKVEGHDVLDNQGKDIAKEQIWQRIKPGAIVFYCEAKAVTPAFLKTLSSEATIVVPSAKK